MIAKQKLITLPYQIKQLHFAVNCQYVTNEKSWPEYLSERHPEMPIPEYILMSDYFRLKSILSIYLNKFINKPDNVFMSKNMYTEEYTHSLIETIHKYVGHLRESASKYVSEHSPFNVCVNDLIIAADHAVAFLTAVLEVKAVNWVTFEIQD